MNKEHKNNINMNSHFIGFRCDKHINKMIEDYMEKQDCDKSTAIREILHYFMELGGVDLIKD